MAVIIPVVSKFDDKGIKQAQSAFSGLGSSMKGILGAAGIGLGLNAVVSGLKESASAAIEDVKSQALLAQQLRNTIGATDGQIKSVEDSIAVMQRQAAVADDVIRPAFASLVRATGDVGQATKLTNLALDVAAGTGKDLGTVSLALGKAVNGSTTSLLKLVPSIKGASDPMGELAKQFAGAAEAAANNDPIQQMSIVMQDLQEQIGMYLLPALKELAKYLSSSDFKDSVDSAFTGFDKIFSAVDSLIGRIPVLGDAFKGLGAQLANGNWTKFIPIIGSWIDIINNSNPARGTNAASSRLTNQALAYQASQRLAGGTKPGATGISSKTSLGAAQAAAKKAAAEAASIAKNIAEVNAMLFKSAEDAAKKAAEVTKAAAEDALAAARDIVDQLQSVADAAQEESNRYQQALNPLPPTVIEVYQSALDNLAKIQEESKRTLDDMTKGMAEIRAQASLTAGSFKDLAKTADGVGAWEQKLNDSFSNLTASADSAFNNKLITEDAYKNLKAYANREKALLTDIAKKRDALAEKISLAKSLYASTKSAVMNFGNITGLLKQQSETITETSTKIIDGIAVTFTKTFEKITSTNLVDEYKKIIDKTKTFAGNLKTLRDQGLNKELFAQIVGAGVDVGGETAAALASGGPEVIKELNGLFEELQAVGTQVAETTTVVMFNNGQDVAGGFIEGLMAEDDSLASAATALATIFADTFQANLSNAMDSVLAAMKAQLDAAIASAKAAVDQARANLQTAADTAAATAKAATDALNLGKNDVAKKEAALAALGMPGISATDFIQGYGRVTSTGTNPNGQPVTINVNAGVIANKQELPGIIVDALGTYTKQSGAGGLTRVLGL